MLDTSTTVKRFAMALLGACLLMLGTPLLGVTPASAGTPSGPVAIGAIGLRVSTGGEYQAFSNADSNITNFVINSYEPGAGYDPIASMQMTLQDTTTGAAAQLKQTLTTAPWVFALNPAADGVAGNAQQLVFTAFNLNNVVLATTTMNAVFRNNPKAQITGPAGNTITLDASNNLTTSGTYNAASGGIPISSYYYIRDNSTGELVGSSTPPRTNTTNTWSYTGPPVACPNPQSSGGCDLILSAQVGSGGTSGSPLSHTYTTEQRQWRIRPYNAATPVATTLSLTPATSSGMAGTPKVMVATLADQTGAAMQGQTITLTKTGNGGNTATLSPTSGVTNYNGQVQTSINNNFSETTTVTASVTGVPSVTATYTSLAVGAGAFTALPVKALNATPYTGSQTGTGSTGPVGTEYPFSSPAVRMCFTYTSGAAVDSSNAAITAKVNVSLTRTVKTGTTSTVGSATTPTLTQDQSANPGCYLVAHIAAGSEEEGQDAFTGYYNGDGVAGYQASGADVQATPVTTSWGQHKLTGSTGTTQISTYGTATFSSKTPDGQSFVGRKLNIAVSSPSTSTLNPTQPTGTTYVNATTATCLTSASGTCTVSVTDANLVTTTLTASDNITSASPSQTATGGWGTAQVTFNVAPPTSGSFTSTPAKTLYAVPFTGTLAGTGSAAPVGSEYALASQASRVCFTYAGGSPIDASNATAASRVFVTATRTTKIGGASTTGAATPLPLTQDQSANPGCFLLPRVAPGSEDSGSDAATGYYNADGIAGYQAGNGDILVTPAAIAWGQLKTTGSTTTGLKGRYATATFLSQTPDGTGFAGRKLTLTVTSPASSTFNPTQPAGTIYANATTAICTTDSNGGCAVSVTDANTASTVITASDNITNTTPAQIGTGGWGTANVTFNSTPGGLDSVGVSPVSVLQPSANTGPNRQRPGDIGHYSYTLLDNNGGPLASKTVALSLSQGYFTPDCLSYAACTFNPTPADGNTVGAAATLGQSINATSDANGVFTFATSIARDSKLDANGQLPVGLTVIGANGAATAGLTTFSTLGTALANANNLSIVPLTSSDALTGTVASNGTNKIPGQAGLLAKPGSDFQLRLTDGFGNLATLSNCAVTLTLTPVGTQTTGAAPYLGSPGNTGANGCGSFTTTASLNGIAPESFHLDSDNPSSTANGVLVTASWAIPWTRYTAVAGPPATTYTTTAGTATPLSNSKQLNLYAMDQRTLTTAMSRAPGSTVQLNTPVTVTAKITDSAGNPLAGASLTWQRSGPNDATGTSQTVGGSSTTSATGTATFTFTSPTVGTATITAITKNASGTELTRGTSSTTFTTGPTPTGSPTPMPTGTATGTASPTPAPTGTASPGPTSTASPTPTGTGTPTGTASPTPTGTASPTATPTATPSPVPTSPAGSSVTISGTGSQTPRYGTVFIITGTAPAGAVVTLRFHKSGTPVGSYGLIRTLTTPASGVWTRPMAASFDYRYYATLDTTAGQVSSNNVLFQPSPIINGPLDVTTAKNLPYTITGKAAPYSLLYLHFHKQGTPASDYSIVRAVRTNSVGTWSRAILASSDYRYYASRNAADTPAGKANYRFMAR